MCPISFTKYHINTDFIKVKSGFFRQVEDKCHMYTVNDVRLVKSFMQRIFKVGTVIAIASDKTCPEIRLENIRNSSQIRDYIFYTAESERNKRQTIYTRGVG